LKTGSIPRSTSNFARNQLFVSYTLPGRDQRGQQGVRRGWGNAQVGQRAAFLKGVDYERNLCWTARIEGGKDVFIDADARKPEATTARHITIQEEGGTYAGLPKAAILPQNAAKEQFQGLGRIMY
jgi:hypothetical protein